MPRVVSFLVLLAILLLIGSLFFQVMVQFLVPLFLAAVLVVMFKPLHLWLLQRCGKHDRLAAALTTLAIVLIVLLPLTGMLVRAVSEGAELYGTFSRNALDQQQQEEQKAAASPEVNAPENTLDNALDASSLQTFVDQVMTKVNTLLAKLHLPTIPSEDVYGYVNENLKKIAAPLALGGVRMLGSTLIGLAILVLALYYFFADGPGMVTTLMRLSPLEDTYEQELLDKFGDISRAVVIATLASAVGQGLLAGVGYYFAGVERIFFLTALTMFLAMVPFVGAAAVWAPVCAWFYFYLGHTTAAVVLAIYCATVVSMIDNLIKPLVLHGQANLHPLLALLSVIGGVQALGPIGILVGPMIVSFLQALLNMLNKELLVLGQTPAPAVSASAATPLQQPRKSKKKK